MRFMLRLRTVAYAASLVMLLALSAYAAPGKGGGGGRGGAPSAAFTLEDSAGDAVLSDGLGAYEGKVTNDYDGQAVEISFPKGRSWFLDFSDCDESTGQGCDGAFGAGTPTGEVTSAVTLTLWGLQGAPNTEDRVGAYLEFQNAEGRWELSALVSVQRLGDDDGDGLADHFVLQNRDNTRSGLGRFVSQRSPFSNNGGYVSAGVYYMPWGAQLSIQ
jgi:hypothetical protein